MQKQKSVSNAIPLHSATLPLVERLTAGLEAGGETRVIALASLRGNVRNLTFDRCGCRVVQLAIKVAEQDVVAELVRELHGHVYEAVHSPYGNYVIQKIVQVLPLSIAKFVSEELSGVAGSVARHRYGCRILCRIFEQPIVDAVVVALAEELIAETVHLSRHVYAHHGMQALIEPGLPHHRQQSIGALRRNMSVNAQNRNANYVIETILKHCDPKDSQHFIMDLLAIRYRPMTRQNQKLLQNWKVRPKINGTPTPSSFTTAAGVG